jgi:hypothetical protein
VGKHDQPYFGRVDAGRRQLACEICSLARLTGIDHDYTVTANDITLVETERNGVNRHRHRQLPLP